MGYCTARGFELPELKALQTPARRGRDRQMSPCERGGVAGGMWGLWSSGFPAGSWGVCRPRGLMERKEGKRGAGLRLPTQVSAPLGKNIQVHKVKEIERKALP